MPITIINAKYHIKKIVFLGRPVFLSYGGGGVFFRAGMSFESSLLASMTS